MSEIQILSEKLHRAYRFDIVKLPYMYQALHLAYEEDMMIRPLVVYPCACGEHRAV